MQKKVAFRALSTPSTAVVDRGDASISGSCLTESDTRYPTRFQTRLPAHSPTSTASDKRADFTIHHLKALNSELHAKLRAKTAENNQLKLDLARQKAEHEKDVRQVQLQQKKATEMMARTLKHAEDLIKEKEQIIGKQQDLIGKMGTRKQPGMGGVPGRVQSFHGRTDVARIKPTDSGFVRSMSLRSQPVTPLIRRPISGRPQRLAEEKRQEQRELQDTPLLLHSTMPFILDLTQKSRVLQKLQEENRVQSTSKLTGMHSDPRRSLPAAK